MRMDKMPVTPGGKVNKKALPPLKLAAQEIVPPASDMQKELFSIISAVIGNTGFGVTTDLFYAGMSSLSAIKITAQISKKYDISLSAQEVIRAKTIRAIEALVAQAGGAKRVRYEKRESYPLTQSQMGVYMDCAKRPGTLKYNIPSALTFSSLVDAERLAKAFVRVIDAHSYVKTHLAMRGQDLCQMRCDDLAVDVPVIKVSKEGLAQAKAAFVRPFDLFGGPLFRAAVYDTGKKVCLLSDFHHIVFDAGP